MLATTKFSAAIALTILFFSIASQAHTSAQIEMKCPIDETKFKTIVTVSMTTFGSYLDFQKKGAIGSYYEDLIHSCPKCHFAGYDEDFKKTYDDNFKKWIFAELTPLQKNKNLNHLEECEFAAKIYEYQKKKNDQIGNLYLFGSYLLRDDKTQQDKRKQLQLSASRYFIKSLEAKEPEQNVRGLLSYLIAELNRRAEKFDEAKLWFEKSIKETDNPDWLKKVIKEQKILAVKKDSNNGI